MEEVAMAARHAQELTVAATHAAREDATIHAWDAQKERERAQKMREEAEGSMAAVKEESQKEQRAMDEERHEAEAAKSLTQEMARTAEQESRKVVLTKEETEIRSKEGTQPLVIPSPTEVAAAKRRMQYREDCFHFAVAGTSGSGKSSLVNAFRGLRSQDVGAAAVGVTGTPLEMTRYPVPMSPVRVRSNAVTSNTSTIRVSMSLTASSCCSTTMSEGHNKLYNTGRKQFIEKMTWSVRTNLEDADLGPLRV